MTPDQRRLERLERLVEALAEQTHCRKCSVLVVKREVTRGDDPVWVWVAADDLDTWCFGNFGHNPNHE